MNGNEEGIDCGGSCPPCIVPDAQCGIMTVYVDPTNPVYDGPGGNDIWWVPVTDLDAGSSSTSPSAELDVRRFLSAITFEWTTQGACRDVTPNGNYNNKDKGYAWRECLPVRRRDFNRWKLYRLRIQDDFGSDNCFGLVKAKPLAPGLALVGAPTVHYAIPKGEELIGTSFKEKDAAQRLITSQPQLIREFSVFPNPGNDILNIRWQATIERPAHLQAIRMGAQILSAATISGFSGHNQLTLDVSGLPQGEYSVHLWSETFNEQVAWVKL